MDQPHVPQKFSSFSSSSSNRKEKHEIDRNLSLGSIKFEQGNEKKEQLGAKEDAIEEGDENEDGDEGTQCEAAAAEKDEEEERHVEEPEPSFASLSEGIDQFLGVLRGGIDADGEERSPETPEIPEAVIEKFVAFVEREIIKFESGEEKWSSDNDELPLLDAVERVSKLTTAVTNLSSADERYNQAMNRAGGVLHHAMCFLEDEFNSLLEDPKARQLLDPGSGSKAKRSGSFNRGHESDRGAQTAAESGTDESSSHAFPPETVERLRTIAEAMISAGYDTECCQVFSTARRNACEAALPSLGFEKISIDDVLKMQWEGLETEIGNWCKAYKHAVTVSLTGERDLCEAVFASRQDICRSIFHDLVRGVTIQLLAFAEAIHMTKRSAEKLFKVLDVFETLRDTAPTIDGLFSGAGEGSQQDELSTAFSDLRGEISSARTRLGEAAVAIFCDLEGSIKADAGKTPVPGGAVHPLTRYVMNYLKYACEYKNTLEQVFREHRDPEGLSKLDEDAGDDTQEGGGAGAVAVSNGRNSNNTTDHNPFAAQLLEVMDLLHSNLEAKSKLYKDLALCNIFLMNNGRYIVQKIKGSAEIHQLLGDTWSRRRSTELRQYHKNYQRETWSRVLACFKDEGLQSRGNVVKPVLKERFKSFNALFEEIHKAQSAWVVSDEQLQSELRVSISAVVVPAYRSFLGRFSQYMTPGRQTEKYIKFGADDLESFVDELFDGNPAPSLYNRRRT